MDGARDLLIDQLTLRFGPLSEAVIARVQGAGLHLIRRWAERVLSAASLDEVFSGAA